MKLGERRTILVGAFTVIVLVTTMWFGFRSRTLNAPQERNGSSPPSMSRHAPQAHSTTTPVVAAGPISTPATEEERQKAIDRLEATSIVFFGKVVDERDLPVRGARVTYTVHHLKFYGNPRVEGGLTDTEGRFEIRTQGPSITVFVSHPQFHEGKDAEREVDYDKTKTAPGPSRLISTRDSPVLFRLVRKSEAETIIHVRSKEIRLPLDGRAVEVSLGERSLTVSARLQSAGASLAPNEFRRFDWNLRLTVPNGGLLDRPDSLDFQAPEVGYVPEIEIQMTSAGNLPWSSRINRDYFVHFANGRYGRFQVTVSGETGFCRFESYLNPSGSRNLEVDPAKLVESPVSRND
jgi:hypothetical protein